MLQQIGGEDDIEALIRKRKATTVVFHYRIDLMVAIDRARQIDRADIEAPVSQQFCLITGAAADLEDTSTRREVWQYRQDLVIADHVKKFNGEHVEALRQSYPAMCRRSAIPARRARSLQDLVNLLPNEQDARSSP